MAKVEVDDIILAKHALVHNHKLDFVIALSGIDITVSELKVAIYLGAFRANTSSGKCNPSVDRIAFETKLSVSGVEKAIKGLKNKGIITLVVKGKNSCDYYLAMPVLSAEVQESRDRKKYQNPPKQAVSNPYGQAGVTRTDRRVSYEQGNRTREEEVEVGAGHRDAEAALTGSCPSIDGQAVAGSSDPVSVHVDMDEKKKETFNLYQSMKDGDADSIIAMIENECGIVSGNWKSYIRKNMRDGTLNEKMISDAKQATIVDSKRAAA